MAKRKIARRELVKRSHHKKPRAETTTEVADRIEAQRSIPEMVIPLRRAPIPTQVSHAIVAPPRHPYPEKFVPLELPAVDDDRGWDWVGIIGAVLLLGAIGYFIWSRG